MSCWKGIGSTLPLRSSVTTAARGRLDEGSNRTNSSHERRQGLPLVGDGSSVPGSEFAI